MTALELFQRLGLDTDVPEARQNLAYALRQAGRYRDAIAILYACRDELAKLGMMFSAAEVCIRLIETQLLANAPDGAVHLCEQAVTFFHEACLPDQAQRAADYLLGAARSGSLQLTAVRDVCAFLTRLRDSPDEQFRLAM